MTLNVKKKVSLKIIKLLFEIDKTDAMDYACKYGHLDIVMFLHSIGKDCTEDGMIYASENGNLDIVKYLHSIEKECTNAIDYASANGHLDVVVYLHEIGEDFTEDTMIYASENGHLDVVKYLHSIGKESVSNGDIVKYCKKCKRKSVMSFRCIYMKLVKRVKGFLPDQEFAMRVRI